MRMLWQDNDLSEFEDSREIVQGLAEEYKACESTDYIKWASNRDQGEPTKPTLDGGDARMPGR